MKYNISFIPSVSQISDTLGNKVCKSTFIDNHRVITPLRCATPVTKLIAVSLSYGRYKDVCFDLYLSHNTNSNNIVFYVNETTFDNKLWYKLSFTPTEFADLYNKAYSH